MCMPKAPKMPEQKVVAKAAAGPKSNNPDIELADVDSASDKSKKKSKGKRGLRVATGSKGNAVGTAGLTPKSLNISTG